MLSLLEVEDRTNQIFQSFSLLENLIEIMFIVNSFSDWEIHLFQGVNTFQYFVKLMLTINLVDGIVQRFQVRQISLNLGKVMGPLDGVNWALQRLQVSQLRLNLSEFMLIFH